MRDIVALLGIVSFIACVIGLLKARSADKKFRQVASAADAYHLSVKAQYAFMIAHGAMAVAYIISRLF